ncbi:hypothetical protein D3C78_1056600 [compost metagenome]
MFAAACSIMLIFLASYTKELSSRIIFCLAGLLSTIILASVMHITIFLLASALLAYLLVYGKKSLLGPRTLFAGALLSFAILAMQIIMPSNFSNIQSSLAEFQQGESMKQKAWESVNQAEDIYLGYGPGQLASKAAFVASGLVQGGFVSNITNPEMSQIFIKTMLPLWNEMSDLYISAGSSQKPYSSWLSLYSEFGMAGVIALSLISIKYILSFRKSNSHESKRAAFGCICIAIFVILIGYQDHYWETPQTMLLAVVLLKILRTKANTQSHLP